MSFNLVVTGGVTNNQAEVDVNNNLKTNLPTTESQAGFVCASAENDTGSITGARYIKSMEVTDDFRLRTGQDNVNFATSFPGAAIDTSLWNTTLTTMTNTVGSGFSSLNAALSVATSAVAIQRTYKQFTQQKQFSLQAEMELQFTTTPQTNNTCEWGLLLAATTAAPTDGAFFRMLPNGEFRCIINYNGTETQSVALNWTTLVGINTTHAFLIYLGSTSATFWIDNILVSEIDAPPGQASVTSSQCLPLLFRNFNSTVSAPGTAQVMKIGQTSVVNADSGMSKPWGAVMTTQGLNAAEGQVGSTLGSTAIYVNAAPAAAAVLVNISAAAQFTGLGGIFNVLPTLVAGTDGILCSFAVPAGTSLIPGKTLCITGVSIDGVVSTVLAGNAAAVIYAASLAYGHTAVSLATAEAATTKAPRRIPLGMQVYGAAAAVGAQGVNISQDFSQCPVAVNAGEFVAIALKNVGVVTTTGAVTFVVSILGYWE
jgi:hypothetical protein